MRTLEAWAGGRVGREWSWAVPAMCTGAGWEGGGAWESYCWGRGVSSQEVLSREQATLPRARARGDFGVS